MTLFRSAQPATRGSVAATGYMSLSIKPRRLYPGHGLCSTMVGCLITHSLRPIQGLRTLHPGQVTVGWGWPVPYFPRVVTPARIASLALKFSLPVCYLFPLQSLCQSVLSARLPPILLTCDWQRRGSGQG
ncbi:hypothetical protein BaRGS_00006328 [Batillaria attramentaria]|uniref:Uncharacterized protein n=1 Tax=Batillaria attramentaria TaxID=370345 RepID=A0ABD0LS56_9CAEN